MVESCLIAKWSVIWMPFEYRTKFCPVFRPPFIYRTGIWMGAWILNYHLDTGHLNTRQVKVHYSDVSVIQIPTVDGRNQFQTLRSQSYESIRNSKIFAKYFLKISQFSRHIQNELILNIVNIMLWLKLLPLPYVFYSNIRAFMLYTVSLQSVALN